MTNADCKSLFLFRYRVIARGLCNTRFRRRHDALIDTLRRSTELLDGTTTEYGHEEVAYIKAVNRRLLRHYDPSGATDRKVG